MIKHRLKTTDQTYLRTVWAWLMSSLVDSSLSSTPCPLRHSHMKSLSGFYVTNWTIKVTYKQMCRWMDV